MEEEESNTRGSLSLNSEKAGRMQEYINAGRSISVSVPPGTQDQFVDKIAHDLIASGAPAPQL